MTFASFIFSRLIYYFVDNYSSNKDIDFFSFILNYLFMWVVSPLADGIAISFTLLPLGYLVLGKE